jgi:hypothetical protein
LNIEILKTTILQERTMDTGVPALIGMAAALVAALAAFVLYRWRQRRGVRRVERWVAEYLAARYGALPGGLHINCSDDRLWPVLVDFGDGATGIQHRLQFDCPGSGASLSPSREEREMRPEVPERRPVSVE